MAASTLPYDIATVVLSSGVVVAQALNVHRGRLFFSKKSLGKWIAGAQIASFTCGILGGLVSCAYGVVSICGQGTDDGREMTNRCTDVGMLMQTYLHAIVIIQRVHIVNVYDLESHVVTVLELLRKRFAEMVWTVLVVVAMWLVLMYHTTSIAHVTATCWLFSIAVMDVTIAFVTIRKVHRMLNTQQKTVVWFWRSLVRASDSHRTLARSTAARLSADKGGSEAAGNVVRSWTLLTLGVFTSGAIYVVGWTCLHSTPLWIPAVDLAWIFGSVWQRGSLMYIDAIRQVAMDNRASKQFLGTATHTGILVESGRTRVAAAEKRSNG
ncbi:hypothetical protein RI367_003099 [Sorochytrium milnesiophthora]